MLLLVFAKEALSSYLLCVIHIDQMVRRLKAIVVVDGFIGCTCDFKRNVSEDI